jgi:topoisomerase IA-like protein
MIRMSVKVKGRVKHNGLIYREGEVIEEITEKEAERLIELGVAEKDKEAEKRRKDKDKAAAEAKEKAEEEEKTAIRNELETLGVTAHPNTGLEKLREKLEEAKAEQKE